jgi:hypothetical protein
MSLALDWWENGPQCLNCGERVMDAEKILSEHGVLFRGICRSAVCIKLPPGGNPFTIAFSKSGEEE